MALRDWIRSGRERGASDLHLESGTPLVYRVRGELMPASETVPAEMLLQEIRELLDPNQWEEFTTRRSVDLSRTLGGTRCRINVFQTVRGIGCAIRLLSSFQNNLTDCNLHPSLRNLVLPRSGLVVISGSTGSGKSTTLAALIEEINTTQRRQIIAIESPIEYFFNNRKSFIRQREIPSHSPSFEQAIVDSLRENPDVLVIGEMRTPDVMRLTLNAAETGHLVLATMHSSTSAEALARICLSFPSELQGSIRSQLADCLVGIVCQRLNYLPAFQMRVPECEVLLANTSAKSNIRAGQFGQIQSVLQSGGEEGMWTFERYQRWMEQKRDWVKPTQAVPLDARDQVSTPIPDLQPRKKPVSKKPAGPQAQSNTSANPPRRSDENVIEIPAVEEDLEALAVKISKSTENDDH
ncbi:MAG: type IV pilus twitching motility protein PilT [Bdellovibrionota bacterium]